MGIGILIGYFAQHDQARSALLRLQQLSFRGTVLVHKDATGTVHIVNPLARNLPLVMTLATCLGGGGAAIAAFFLTRLSVLPLWNNSASLGLIAVGAALGIMTVLFWFGRFRQGTASKQIRAHARWLLPGESVIILRAPVDTLQRPVAMLRAMGETPPALFVLHPKLERRVKKQVSTVKLSPAEILEHAQRHASEQQVDLTPHHNTVLLDRLKQSRKWIRRVCEDLTAAINLEQKTTAAADWILDNEYILEGNARDVLLNLPRHFYRKLPVLANDAYHGLPCIYSLAKDLVAHTEMRLDRENIQAFIEAYQSVRTLSSGELWALPQMMRVALIECIQSLAVTALADLRDRQLADFWANRLIAANRRNANQLFAILAELAQAEPHPSAYFGVQLVGLLYDEVAALSPVQSWLERMLKTPMYDLNLQEQNRQTREQLSCGNAFTSLRQLGLLDWREIFEQMSRVEQLLRLDPSGIYPHMDFATRDRCRRAIEDIAHAARQTEVQIAKRVIKQATVAGEGSTNDEQQKYVGTWLVGEGRAALTRLLTCRETTSYRFLQWIARHHTGIYLLAIGSVTTLLLGLSVVLSRVPLSLACCLGLVGLLLIPVSQLAIEVVHYLITRLLPTRPLAKMDFESSGIPDAFRTLVVVPIMLVNEETIRDEAEKLEIRYLANKEVNLVFGLFSDFTDSITVTCEEDSTLLRIARECIETLNARHGEERFFLLHRQRTWSPSEQHFIGWERKRGKLEELNCLIDGTRPENAPRLVEVGDPNQLADVRFIITLDSDTQLPHATARRMVETLAHPLNQPRFDKAGRVIAGYTLIQPRVSPTLASTSSSIFSRLFADAIGIDPYSQAVSDVYQDLSGEGCYHGKGIYDVRVFSRILSGRFPEERILSHDLIEGAHIRVGLASDIELFDEFPQGYQSYSKRAHRWIRGDWQIAAWIFPRVADGTGGRSINPLSLLNRWKILDNLRRSLLPATSLALLLTSWLIGPRIGILASIVVGMQLLFHPLAQPLTMATTRKGLKYFDPAKVLHDLLRATTDAALLPHQAAVSLDAIFRVWYRQAISRRGLLEWSTQATSCRGSRHQSLFVAGLALASLFSCTVGGVIWTVRPESLMQSLPWLFLWSSSPLLGWLLNLRPAEQLRDGPIPAADRLFLRQVARRTWRYFSTFVSEDTSWLPPDNYQVAHQKRLAMRTSPTNIGLWMTSILGAHDCGYLTVNQTIDKLALTIASIKRLHLHQGHLLNWYDIETLMPLEPRYVSTVDSGNLLGALWALEQGLGELIHQPLLDGRAFIGLADTGQVLQQAVTDQGIANFCHSLLEQFLVTCDTPATGLVERLRLQHNLQQPVGDMAAVAGGMPWVVELTQQLAAWTENSDRYFSWVEILAEVSEEELEILDPTTQYAIRRDLMQLPSLEQLAQGRIDSIAILAALRQAAPPIESSLAAWIDRLLVAFANAQWLAGETLGNAEQLILDIQELSAGMNMRFLYAPKRKLFAIGYDVSTDRLDPSSYDLLASEARLGSFVAIARGDIPLEHWFSMSRPYGAIGRQRVLLSWTGTMFEYLMPLLFQHSYANSLLDKSAREAVAVQMAYGRTNRVPWGISESAFADLDLNKTYQYKAFGVPALGLKRGLEDQLVIAPYATLLALNLAPQETVENMKRLSGLGLLGEYGYFEAMDFSRQPQRESGRERQKRGVVIEAYMAHHQGMSFLALTNFLYDNPFPRRFHSDPRVRAFEALLQERIPTLPPLHLISTRPNEPQLVSDDAVAPATSTCLTPDTVTPVTLLLSNGNYGLMITNSGGGYSQWGGQELTRWRSDPTCDAMGTFCYIHEQDVDRLWSVTPHPVGGKVTGYSVDFNLDRAVFHRIDDKIHTETEVIVSPEDDVEVRRITLVNRSARTRCLHLTSYVELSMAAHNADRQHPAFNKLFIQTEALPEQQALLAYRRPRSENEVPLYMAHGLVLEQEGFNGLQEHNWQFETDRARFIGRGRTLAHPMGAVQQLGNSQGFVLDPIFSSRQVLTLKPGQRARVSLVLAAGASREQVLVLIAKYTDPHATERAMDFTWHSAQQQLQMLRIKPDEARRFQQLASHLLFANQLLRAPAERLLENHKGQAGLWPYAISGDLPIVLITIGEVREISLVRQLLQAHTYWRMHGFSTDLVILNEEAGSYERPLQERLEQLIQTHALSAAVDQPGSIFLKSAAHIPEDDLKLFKAAACVVLVAARGTLPQQLGLPMEAPEQLERFIRKRSTREPSASLPFMELNYFNSLGGFTPDGREYAIYLGPDTSTPAPWVNVIANPSFGTMVSESGSGFSWYGNSQRNRLTGWSNDPVLDPASEALYIRDEESGAFWSPTAAPIREKTAYRARHGAGYTVFEHNSNGIEQELTVFVPVDANGGVPIKLQRLRLTNGSARRRRLSITYYVELTLGENRETSRMHILTHWDHEAQALLAQNRYHPEYAERVAFASISPEAESHSGDRTAFIGRNRSLANPVAMELTEL